MKLEGLHRHASTHAAGIVIGDRPLAELVPMYRDPKSRHAGHPVQHEMGRAGGAGEVRLPRPEDAHRARDRGQARRAGAASISIFSSIPLDDAKTYADAGARRDGRRLPGGRAGHAARAHRHAAGPLRGHHRAGRALPAGPDGEHPDLLRAQARQGAARIHPPEARADPARDLRRHHLPGAGDADRAAALPATSLGEADLLRRAMGKKIRSEMEAQRERFVEGAVERRRREGAGGGDLRTARAICRLRLQQVPRGGLRAASPTRPPT